LNLGSYPAVLPSPHWFLHHTGFHHASNAFTPTCQEVESPSGSNCPLAPGGMHPGNKGGDKSLSLQSQTMSPKNCCRNHKMRYGTLRQFSRKQHFTVLSLTQQTSVQRLSPENKGLSPYRPLQAGYRKKARSNPYMVILIL
jgi:hypothetical protein